MEYIFGNKEQRMINLRKCMRVAMSPKVQTIVHKEISKNKSAFKDSNHSMYHMPNEGVRR